MGSVKDLKTLEAPSTSSLGRGQFIFSDRYSVFDWGEMPDHILNKGASLCVISAYFFEKLGEKYGTHYLGLVEQGKVKRLDELKTASNIMEVKLARVLKPEIRNGKPDYSIFRSERSNFLIPLEIMYRNSLPKGSSVFQRLKKGTVTFQQLGLDRYPEPGIDLEKPILDVSTKLEKGDRYLDWHEAQQIAGLSDEETEYIKRVTLDVNESITSETSRCGLKNEDGKIELAFDLARKVMLVDAIGTPDECRFSVNELPLSKEVARIFYRRTSWHKAVQEAKEQAKRTGIDDWKKLVREIPPSLDDEMKVAMSNLYMTCANALTKRKWFDAPKLGEIVQQLQNLQSRL